MSEYLDKKDLMARIEQEKLSLAASANHYYRESLSDVYGIISKMPTADAKTVIFGKWLKDRNQRKCSNCGFYYYSNNDDYNFCPECGADMRGLLLSTNYNRIKSMTVQEMADCIYSHNDELNDTICKNTYTECPFGDDVEPSNCKECIKKWLESEVDTK